MTKSPSEIQFPSHTLCTSNQPLVLVLRKFAGFPCLCSVSGCRTSEAVKGSDKELSSLYFRRRISRYPREEYSRVLITKE